MGKMEGQLGKLQYSMLLEECLVFLDSDFWIDMRGVGCGEARNR